MAYNQKEKSYCKYREMHLCICNQRESWWKNGKGKVIKRVMIRGIIFNHIKNSLLGKKQILKQTTVQIFKTKW